MNLLRGLSKTFVRICIYLILFLCAYRIVFPSLYHGLAKMFDDEFESSGDSCKPRAMIIDGPSLLIVMADTALDGLRDLFLVFVQRCRAVVAWRVSPDQKRELVDLIKNGVPGVRTLAVGDAANDVAMIQAAHVGVGIRGEEGLQAVNAADYAIAQFRYLSPLMLKHGHLNYVRMCGLICFMFYKNILMSTAQFWFNFNCGFSGQKYYTEGSIQLFNLFYSSAPILMYAVYDMIVLPENCYRFPQLYISGINNNHFKSNVFWSWILAALFESVIFSVIPLYLLQGSREGVFATFWESGATCMTAIVITVNCKLLFLHTRWRLVHFYVLFAFWFCSVMDIIRICHQLHYFF